MEVNQTLHDVWLSPGLVYAFLGAFALKHNFARCKIHLTLKNWVLLYWQRYCMALEQWASVKLCGVVQGMQLRNFHRGRHLYSAGRPLRWASAHILVCSFVVARKNVSQMTYFWATVCKTVRPMLSVRCLSCPVLSVCLSVCNVGVLWLNDCTDQDETWHAGRPRPWPHCIKWGPSSPSPKGAQPPNFRPISVTAKWLHGSRCHLVSR